MTATWPRLHQLAADAGLEITGPHPHNAVSHEARVFRGRDLRLVVQAYGVDRDESLRRSVADAIAAEADRLTAARIRSRTLRKVPRRRK